MQRLFIWCVISAVSGPCKFIMALFINRTVSAFLFFVLFFFIFLLFLTPSVTHCADVHVYYAHAKNLVPCRC